MTDFTQLAKLILPEAVVAATLFVMLFADLSVARRWPAHLRRSVACVLCGAGCLVAFSLAWLFPVSGSMFNGMWVVGAWSLLIKSALLLLTMAVLVVFHDSEFTSHVGEYCALVLLALLGFMGMVSTHNLLMLFVSLELASLSLYGLAAFAKDDTLASEAALKYFLFGSVSAAFLLFGLSLIYGLTGETQMALVALKLKAAGGSPLLYVALAMMLVGFGFKVAAAPFHFWAPDVYQAAPLPSTAVIASGSKVAGFALLAVMAMVGLAGVGGSGSWRQFVPGWIPLIALAAILSMAIGNLMALAQSSVRRLLAYSAIAHAGYTLIGIVANNGDGLAATAFYSITYAVTVLGAFAAVGIVARDAGSDDIASFAGLSKRSPVLALCLLVFILSLAGIPPLAGFFGKFYLFAAVLRNPAGSMGMFWLVLFAIAMSAVSLYYYLQVLKQVYARTGAGLTTNLEVEPLLQAMLIGLAGVVVLLGCSPDWLLQMFTSAIRGLI